MLEIYHAPGTRGLRVIWACEELGVPYRLTRVDFSAQYRASPEWRRLNPVGKVPAMKDGDLAMFESCAMVQYVLDRYGGGRLQPAAGTPEHALYLQWCWFAEATFARPIGEIVNHRRAFPEPIAAVEDEMHARSRACADAVGDAVEGRAFLLGDAFTAADVMMGYTLHVYGRVLSEELPAKAGAYYRRLGERAAFQRARRADRME